MFVSSVTPHWYVANDDEGSDDYSNDDDDVKKIFIQKITKFLKPPIHFIDSHFLSSILSSLATEAF